MTVELLSSVAGIILSLIFSYVPGAKDWFNSLMPDYKRLVMLGILFGVSLAIFGISCTTFAQYFGIVGLCDEAGAVVILKAFISAMIANQSAYIVSPKTVG